MLIYVNEGWKFSFKKVRPTNQCTRIAKQRLIKIGWGCEVVFVLKVALLARNRVISSVRRQRRKEKDGEKVRIESKPSSSESIKWTVPNQMPAHPVVVIWR